MNWKLFALTLLINLGMIAGCRPTAPTPPTALTTQELPQNIPPLGEQQEATLEPAASSTTSQSPTPTETETPVLTKTPSPTKTLFPTNTALPSWTPTPTRVMPTPSPINTLTPGTTPIPTATVCVKQTSLYSYTIQRGDTLSRIAQASDATVAEVMADNCLLNDRIYVGDRLYVRKQIFLPPLVVSTVPASLTNMANPSVTPCVSMNGSCDNGSGEPPITEPPTEAETPICPPRDRSCGMGNR